MDIAEVSLLHHVGIVFLVLWLLNSLSCCHPISYFMSLIYLFMVHERYVLRLWKKLQFEERRQANKRKVFSDSETARWLNHVIAKMWPICMEPIASQKILLPIIPWFLDKYKPWTAKQALVQHLYLGRNPPVFTEMRVRESSDDDHLVLELGMNFLTADDMSAVIAVKLRKRLGFGMWTKLHMTGLHIEGKVLIGVKFLNHWPFLGRLRLCFLEPPYVQMIVKPLFNHGFDVAEVPGIAGWLDNLLSIAFEQTLVEPNMLVVDLEKFVSPQPENWFFVDGKEPVAYAKVEVIEGTNMRPADLNGLADPYTKGQLGPYRFRTRTQKKTLDPKWHEEFKIPIGSWDSPNILVIEVCDKDHFVDDKLGDCSMNISDLRDGQRHSLWLPLQNVKTGKLHLAVTVVENNTKLLQLPQQYEEEEKEEEETPDQDGSFSFETTLESPNATDVLEPINTDRQQDTGNSSAEERPKHQMAPFKKGMHKMNSAFHKSPRRDDHSSIGEDKDTLSGPPSAKAVGSEKSGSESPDQGHDHVKGAARKSYFKQAGKSAARSLKHVLSRKGSRKHSSSGSGQREVYAESESYHDAPPSTSLLRSSSNREMVVSTNSDTLDIKEGNMVTNSDMYHDCFVVESSKEDDLKRKDTSFA